MAHHGPEDLLIAVMTFIGAFVLMAAINARLALITALGGAGHGLDHQPLMAAA